VWVVQQQMDCRTDPSVALFFCIRVTQIQEAYKVNPLAPILSTFLPAAMIAAQHYAPWRQWLRRPLHPLAAYTMGTLAILVPATLASQPRKHKNVVIMFWVAALSAGFTTCAAWAIDALNEHAAKQADREDRLIHGR
jgi:uncharacterized membrane protein